MTTPREQLALMLQEELPCWLIVYATEPEPTTVCDYHGEIKGSYCREALRLADAIIAAGWAPPLPAPPTDTTLEN